MRILGIAVTVLTLALAVAGAEPFRTDINPALRYYQAYLLLPDLAEADHKYLFEEEWRGRSLDVRFGGLVSRYDNSFQVFREAAHARIGCDWGIDMSPGPNVLLPGLARAKLSAQTARLRVMWHLQNGREKEARDDLLAAFALGRNTANDKVLISALVQYAIENIVISVVAENFYRFSPETLQQLVAGFEASPARGTIVQCVPTEKTGFYDWLLRKIDEALQENDGNDEKAYAQLTGVLHQMLALETDKEEFEQNLAKTTGKTSRGLITLVRELEPLYPRVVKMMSLPHREGAPALKEFSEEVRAHRNPLVPIFFLIYEKCRLKETAAEVGVTMLKAAVAYKSEGRAALDRIQDPCGTGPFAFRRVVLEGVDRGFELKSSLEGRGFDEVLIFVETDGPVFRINGPSAGQLVPGQAEAKN